MWSCLVLLCLRVEKESKTKIFKSIWSVYFAFSHVDLAVFRQLISRSLASYAISVRRTKDLPTASFRFHLTMDTLAVQLYISHYLGMFRTFTCESAPMARKRNVRRKAHCKKAAVPSQIRQPFTHFYLLYCPFIHSSSFSILFTAPGFAFPFICFMVWPTRKPRAFSLPPL